jgi:hypothetical protein
MPILQQTQVLEKVGRHSPISCPAFNIWVRFLWKAIRDLSPPSMYYQHLPNIGPKLREWQTIHLGKLNPALQQIYLSVISFCLSDNVSYSWNVTTRYLPQGGYAMLTCPMYSRHEQSKENCILGLF